MPGHSSPIPITGPISGPPPRVHGMRYQRVFAPNAKGRVRVVPEVAEEVKRCGGPPAPRQQEQATEVSEPPQPSPVASSAARRARSPREYRVPWAELLRKVFAAAVLGCPECGGRLQVRLAS